MAPDGTFAASGVSVAIGSNALNSVFVDPYGRTTNRESSVTVVPKTFGYDLNGNMTNDSCFVYAWDCENRLVSVYDASTGDLVQSNRYDALGRRREKVEYGDEGPTTNRFLYKDWLVLAVMDVAGNVLETYTHGADLAERMGGGAGGIGGILALTQANSPAYYHYDFNGNIVGVTSSEQNVLATLTYTPFGEVFTRTDPFISCYQFSTKKRDFLTDLSYYGYRFYSPTMGRWISRDPIGEIDGINIYAFVRSRVISYTDALGLTGCDGSEEIVWGDWQYTGFEYMYLVSGGGAGSSMADGVILHYSRTGTQTFHCCPDKNVTTTASYDVTLKDPLIVTDSGPNPLGPIPHSGKIIPTLSGMFPSPGVPHSKPEGIDPDAYIPSKDEEGTFQPPACPCEE